MIRFATFSTHKMAQSQMLDAQSRLFDSQMQISSGKVSRNYAGIAIESRRLVNLENAVTGVNGFIRIIDVTESRLQLMENAVVGAFDLAQPGQRPVSYPPHYLAWSMLPLGLALIAFAGWSGKRKTIETQERS